VFQTTAKLEQLWRHLVAYLQAAGIEKRGDAQDYKS
jgi:hypothetical protein